MRSSDLLFSSEISKHQKCLRDPLPQIAHAEDVEAGTTIPTGNQQDEAVVVVAADATQEDEVEADAKLPVSQVRNSLLMGT